MRSTRGSEVLTRLLVLLCALPSMLLSACPALPDGPRYEGAGHTTPVRGGTLMLWEEARVRMLDPHAAMDTISGVLISLLFDSLYANDLEMKLQPRIASALPTISDDGRTLTIPIRRGVRFHNGRVLTARDVVWSFERMLHPDLHSPGVPFFSAIVGLTEYQAKQASHIRGLSAPDDATFRIELEYPDQSFAGKLAMRFASPVPREEVERKGADMRRRPVGQGAFRLVSWDPGVRLVLERNPHYYVPDRPYLDRVVFEEGLKRDTAFMRFRNGEVDLVTRMAPPDLMTVRSGRWRPYSAMSPQFDVWGILMNTEMAPFDNVHLRRAVAFAIDRARWARVRNDALKPAGQLVPPRVMGYDPNLPHLQHFNLQKAREELRLAGYPNGLPEPVTIWSGDSSHARQYCELLQSDLSKIGIEVSPKYTSFPVYLEQTGRPKTAQMLAGGWVMDFPDPSNVFHIVSSGTRTKTDSMNRSFFGDPKLDTLLARALVERDVGRRAALYREANDLVAEAAPWAVFANSQSPHAWQPYVKGYVPHPTVWIDVHDVWLDLPRQRTARKQAALEAALAGQRKLAGLFPMLGDAR